MTAPAQPTVSPEIIRRLMLFAVIATIFLTAAAFWLSYEHLHDVAGLNGLDGARAWAWPATVDTFIVIGESMILVASLLRRTDRVAVFVTVVGSVGSIALNVAGVGMHAAGMFYIVAAVPPSAALLAFGLLMRQFKFALIKHGSVADEFTAAVDNSTLEPTAADAASDARTDADSSDSRRHPDATEAAVADAGTAVEATTTDAPSDAPSDAASVDSTHAPVDETTPAPTPIRRRKPTRSGVKKKATRRPLNEWVDLAGPIFHDEFRRLRRQPTANEFAQAIEKAGHGLVSDTTAKTIRAEILDRAEVPALVEEGL